MAIFRVDCFNTEKGKHFFYFDGDSYVQEMTPRLDESGEKEYIVRFCDVCSKPNTFKESPKRDKGQLIPVIDARESTKEEVDTVNRADALIRDAPDRLDTLATTLIGLDTGLVTLYTGAITFLKISETSRYASWPIIFWILSIFATALVYWPRMINFYASSPGSIKAALKDLVNVKYLLISCGFIAFILALIIASIVIMGGNTSQDISEPLTVRFVVPEDQLSFFNSLSFNVSPDTLMTRDLTLLDSEDGLFKVQVPGDNKNITFNQSLVKAIIYFNTTSGAPAT